MFEALKNRACDENGNLTQANILLCGLGAGLSEAVLIVCPMETVKVKFIHDQTQPNPKYRGFLHGVSTMIKTEGGYNWLKIYQSTISCFHTKYVTYIQVHLLQ